MMFNKKVALLGFLTVFLTGLNSMANSECAGTKTMRVSVNPGALILGSLPVNFEMAVAEKISLGFFVSGQFFSFSKDTSYHGGGAGFGAKFHLTNKAFCDGWYFKPTIDAQYTGLKLSSAKGEFFSIAPSVSLGYDWVWDSGFSIGLGLGVQYKHIFVSTSLKDQDMPFGIKGILPSGEFTVGWAW